MGRVRERWRGVALSIALAAMVITLAACSSSGLTGTNASSAASSPVGTALEAIGYSGVAFQTDGVWYVKCPGGFASNCKGHYFTTYITKAAPAVFVSSDGTSVVTLRGPDNVMNSIFVKGFNATARHFNKLSKAAKKQFLKLTGYCLTKIGGAAKLEVNSALGPITCYIGPA